MVVDPYPKDQLCPKCKESITDLLLIKWEEEIPQPKEFNTIKSTASSKLKGKVKVKKKSQVLSMDSDIIELQKGEYIKLLGITSVNRIPLFFSNQNYVYLLELTNNLDFIATSILGGVLDKMLLINKKDEKEKCQFYCKNNIIYIVYGLFPDKKGKWLLEQMEKHYSELVQGKNVDAFDKLEKHQIDLKFKSVLEFILKEYLKMQEIFSDQEIPYIEDKIRIDYVGLSSKSIGIISLLLGEELNIELPGQFDHPEEIIEMKESVLTAKIEAIAANTLGNTNAFPSWIAVKLGYQNYRFLTFKNFRNDYFLYMLSEGNLEKKNIVEEQLKSYFKDLINIPFSGNLKPFNKIKISLKEFFKKGLEFS